MTMPSTASPPRQKLLLPTILTVVGVGVLCLLVLVTMLSYGVLLRPDLAALRTVFARVQGHPGTVIEFDPEPIREGAATHHFICAMPGGIRIEFATPFA